MNNKEEFDLISTKIEQYRKQYPDWTFEREENENDGKVYFHWVVKGPDFMRTKYLEVLDDSKADKIQEEYGIDAHNAIYCSIPNNYPSGKDNFYTFIGRPGDALQAIKDGQGDVLSIQNLFGKVHSVLFFLDRKIGEELRARTLEGFKDSVFKYVLQLHTTSGWGHDYFMGEKGEAISQSWNFDNKQPKFFDTEEEVKKLIESEKEAIDTLVKCVQNSSDYEAYFPSYGEGSFTITHTAALAQLDLDKEPTDKPAVAYYLSVAQELVRENQ